MAVASDGSHYALPDSLGVIAGGGAFPFMVVEGAKRAGCRVVVLGIPGREPFALINPEVVRRTGERRVTEGCLSVPGYRGEITRSLSVVVRALDAKGRQTRIRASAKTDDEDEALLAQALEHEVDHVNGFLYIDHLASLDELVKIEPEEEAPEEEVKEPEGEVEEAEKSG